MERAQERERGGGKSSKCDLSVTPGHFTHICLSLSLFCSRPPDHLLPLCCEPVIWLKSLQSLTPLRFPLLAMSALSLLCDVNALFFSLTAALRLTLLLPPPHHNNFRFKYCYSLSDSDPVSAKLFSEAWAALLEYLMSPLG